MWAAKLRDVLLNRTGDGFTGISGVESGKAEPLVGGPPA
jgi:hypothetical protein